MSYIVLQLTPEQAAGLLALAEHGRQDPAYRAVSLKNLAGHDAGLALLQLAVDRQCEARALLPGARPTRVREAVARLTEREAKALLACADEILDMARAKKIRADEFTIAARGGCARVRLAMEVAGIS